MWREVQRHEIKKPDGQTAARTYRSPAGSLLPAVVDGFPNEFDQHL